MLYFSNELSYRMSAGPPVSCPNWNFCVHQPASGSFGRAVLVVVVTWCDVLVAVILVMFGWLCFGGVGGFQQNMRDMWVMCGFLCWPSFVWLDWCYFWSQEPYEPDWSERVCEWMQKQRPQWICEDIWPMMVSRNVKTRKRDMKRSHVKPPLQRTHRGMQNGNQNMAVHIDHPDPSKVYFNAPATDRDKSRPPNTAPATKSDNSTLLWSTLLVQSLYIGNVLTKIPLTIYCRFNCI